MNISMIRDRQFSVMTPVRSESFQKSTRPENSVLSRKICLFIDTGDSERAL